MTIQHIPVLAQEILNTLELSLGDTVVDGTCGLGGHTLLFAQAVGPSGKVFAFDKDARNLALAQERLHDYRDRITFVHDSYEHIDRYIQNVNGILLDLGYSSAHVDDPLRGFSFQADGPLDMRYDIRDALTAEIIVNSWSRDDLAEIFRLYGEEPRAHVAAKAICDARKKERITSTVALVVILQRVIPRTGKIHPATRIFQALRIAVNDELGVVERGIARAFSVLAPKGKLAVISFHSLEDRIVKRAFLAQTSGKILTKKPIIAGREEQRSNPRSRSAKLRIFERV